MLLFPLQRGGLEVYVNLFQALSITFPVLADTATLSTSQLRWSTVMDEKLKGPIPPSATTCVFLNGCQRIAYWNEKSGRDIISVQTQCT